MNRRRKYQALVLCVAVAGSIAFAFSASGRSAPWPFTSVTPQELAREGVTLTAATPPANVPTTAADAAAAARKFQGHRALEVHYAHCVDTTNVPRLDQGCWAVSIDPRGMTAPGGLVLAPSAYTTTPSSPAIHYDVVFVDPMSGKVIEATLG